ncbi:MAG: ATP-binding protein [Gemmatimonadaceae bacterium]
MRSRRIHLPEPGPLTLALATGGIAAIYFATAQLFGWPIGLGHLLLPAELGIAVVAYISTARRAGRTRRAVFTALAGCAAFGLAGRLMSLSLPNGHPFAALLEGFSQIAAQLCLLAGLTALLRGQVLRLRSEATLDALLLVAAAAVVALQMPYQTVTSNIAALERLRGVSLVWNLLGGANLILMALLLAWRGDLMGVRMSLGLALGTMALFLANMFYIRETLAGGSGLDPLTALLWVSAHLAYLAAARVPRGREPDLSAELPTFASSADKVRLVSIVAAILIASSSALVMHFRDERSFAVALAIAIFGLLLAARAGYALWKQQQTATALESTVVAEREVSETLEHEVAMRTRELAGAQRALQRMWTLAQQISIELRTDHVLRRFTEAVVDVVQADGGAVGLLLDPARVQIAASVGLDPSVAGRVIPVESTAIGGVVRTGDIWWDEDVQMRGSHGRMPEAELAPGAFVRGMAIVPLQRRGERIGVVVLVSSRRRRFTDEEISNVEAMSDLLSVALANADLVDSLRKTEWRFRTLFRVAPDAVLTVFQSGRVMEANEAARDLTGLQATQVVGRMVDEFLLQEDRERFRHGLMEAFSGAPSRIEIRFRNDGDASAGGGSVRIVSLAARLLPEADPPTVLLVGRDVTVDREMRARLEETERLAAVGELVAGVAHEVNNPLSTISAFAQLLQRDRSLDAEQRESIDVIHSETVRASQVLKDLLTFARRSEGERQSVDLNELVERTIRLRGYELTANSVRAELDLAERLPQACGDARQLQQVLLNLVANAIQAMAPQGGGLLRITTRVEVQEDRVVMEVSDTGPGVPPQARARLFEPFFTTKPEGTGLGLSVSYGIVTAHGGAISVASTSSAGTTFRVALPVATDVMIDVPTPIPASLIRSPLAGMRLLFIDDEPSLRIGMEAFSRLRRFSVTTAADGQNAIAAIRRDAFDAVVCDLWMPGMDGPAFFEVLRREHPLLATRTIFITGDLVSGINKRFLSATGQPVLTKPFEFERLEHMVASVLNAHTLTTAAAS